ncbi:1-acyl-sn-glycerol-3-phosphate acyltransferase [Massilia sp. TS11]|uniref:lysophospholipid acyltransferase family protein n=1 Tax=Massilia sp. TS11 TaxID=2908003 RepID=UPI001EDAEA0B|nr:lysophospholipid acyltransferase family protein [Massilia sp. TS11]MCG2583467.1 1-acyl-sn-glycerol-3-phosphate acyltransferase [Massilia sp. TS11]
MRFAWRLARVLFHLGAGLLRLALGFPFMSETERRARIQRWSRQLVGICGIEVVAMPGPAALERALVVANHISWIDIFVINSLYPCRFVAKSEIRAWPVVGWLVAKAGTVFIARGNRRDLRHIFKGLVERLQAGERVAFFPEGTTAAQGQILPFHANLFEAAIDAQAPLQPYALRYLERDGRLADSVNFIGDTTFVGSLLMILRGPPLRAELHCLAPLSAAGAHRRELAQAAHDAVRAALQLREAA